MPYGLPLHVEIVEILVGKFHSHPSIMIEIFCTDSSLSRNDAASKLKEIMENHILKSVNLPVAPM